MTDADRDLPVWHNAECGVCGRVHGVCRFRRGLYCVVAGCANPHHRPWPVGYEVPEVTP